MTEAEWLGATDIYDPVTSAPPTTIRVMMMPPRMSAPESVLPAQRNRRPGRTQ
jgi:hypothetical protein